MNRFSVCGLLTALIVLPGCAEKTPQAASRTAVPVVIAVAAKKDIPFQSRIIGTVEAYSTVVIKSLVNGELKSIHFREGQDVRQGDLLFSIDSRPLETDLRRAQANLARDIAQGKQAEANLARDTAELKNAQAEAQRYQRLFEQGIVSREEYDRTRTRAETYEAVVSADQAAIENSEQIVRAGRAAIENAKLRLDYCSIRAPNDGRTGIVMVHPGNLVKENDTELVTINQVSPIYVTFSVPEDLLAEVKKYMATGSLVLEAAGPGAEKNPSRGILTFVNNAVDSATGTIRLKGTFANGNRDLWPGQFVNVVLTLATESAVVVVPSQSVQTGQSGSFVFVVNQDLSVESRAVSTGRTYAGDIVITQGLQAGEKIVADGQLRLVPGSKVEIKGSLQPVSGTHP